MRFWIRCLIVLLGAVCASTPLQAARISGLSTHIGSHLWRFEFELTRPVRYNAFVLQHPNRVVIDFHGVDRSVTFGAAVTADTPVKTIRAAEHAGHTFRVVMDLEHAVKLKTNLLKLSASHARLVVSLIGQRQKVIGFAWPDFHSSVKPHATPKINQKLPASLWPKAHATFKPKSNKAHQSKLSKPHGASLKGVAKALVPIEFATRKRSQQVIVVIDPGHGGKDPGATGPRGIHEKTIVLQIAKKLYRLLNRQQGFKAYLTRNRDYYLTLRQRLAIARRDKADMFIAIHADAFHRRNARGASVFALSEKGATSEAARWIAERENASELMGGVDLADKSNLLRSVLINLSQNATVRASLIIGGDIIRSIARFATLHHNKVEQAAFVVLKSPDIPSLLVETGFLSNPYEERRLSSSRYQLKIARALETGIVKYFHSHPPPGTWLADRKHRGSTDAKRYVVRSGDNLTVLATRFRTTVKAIVRRNRLSYSQLKIGQVLTIPVT